MDPAEILSRLGTDTPPTDDELREARREFGVLLREAAENKDLTEASSLRQARLVLKEELDDRAAAAARDEAKAAEFLADLDDDETGTETDDEEAEVDEAEEPVDKEVLDLAAVRAAAKNQRARIAAAAPDDNPYPAVKISTLGAAAGDRLATTATPRDVASVFSQHARGRDPGRNTLVRVAWDMPEDRRLGANIDESTRLIEQVLSPQALTFEAVAAAGGICGPLEAVFDIPAVGDARRPVRDALSRFGADRGGIRYIPAGRLSTFEPSGGVAVWTAENDASPTSPAEKPCPHIDCSEECTETVDAITACLTVGNFQARFSPEQWGNALHLLSVEHARVAEQNLLAIIDAGSQAATFDGGGTIQSVLGAIDRGIAAVRSRERMSDSVGFRVIVDGWLRAALRDHFTRQRPAGQSGAPGVGDAAIATWFGVRGATVTYTPDDGIFAAEAGGALNDFPATTDIRLFPEGTWLFLDGGTLDLGTEIVDSTLIAQNDRQAFMETFEGAAKRTAPCGAAGDDSLVITTTLDPACICPNVLEVTSP